MCDTARIANGYNEMTPSEKTSVFRQLFLTLWAMTTLVLCFVVGLLINEMLKGGNDPLAAFVPETEEAPNTTHQAAPEINTLGTKEAVLYFTDGDGRWLTPEPLIIEYRKHTVENCRKVLDGLLRGPQSELLYPVLPEQTKVRALYLRPDGELIIDLSSEMLTAQNKPRSAEMEALMVYGVINTLVQPVLQAPDDVAVRTVRFLFDGAMPQESFPAHLDLSAALEPDLHWTRTGSE
jgi:hypothetical protein